MRTECAAELSFLAVVVLGAIAAGAVFLPVGGFPFSLFGALTLAVPAIVGMVLALDRATEAAPRTS
jgi:hypothetical protein